MKQKVIFFLIFLLLFSLVFRSLILNVSFALVDWRDYALMVWIMFQNISNILSLNFSNYFETNAFYPNKYSLLFSDLLLPQSILSLPFYLITRNLILSFNLVFILTFILNYLSTFIFWKQIFKKNILAFLGSLLIIFSPFFHLENSHFQMMSYWPFFFSLYFLFKTSQKRRYLNSLLSGLFLAIQFTASVYLSVYLLVVIVLYYLFNLSRKTLKPSSINLLITFLTFFILSGVFINGYFEMKREYNVKRDLGEYITYSAHLSDYIFTSPINSIIHKSPLLEKWNSFDKNKWGGHSSFPGILILVTALIGIFILVRTKGGTSFNIKLDRQKALFLSIMLLGLIFSLGPRINFNGQYAHIPMPYTLALKFIPLVEATRVPARWSFLFFLGVTFFSLVGIDRLTKNRYRNTVLAFCFLLFFLEYIPLNLKATTESYTDYRTAMLKDLCEGKKQVLIELPVTHLDADNDIASGLSYITRSQLASTEHKCLMVNGYSGYDLPSILNLSQKVNASIDQNNPEQLLSLMKQHDVDLVKFNPDHFPQGRQAALQNFYNSLEKSPGFLKIDQTIYKINPD